MTAQENVTEILARLNAALAPRKAFDIGKVPTTRPPQYVEITLTRRFGGTPTLCGEKHATGYRVTVAAVSQTSVSSVREDLEKCRVALEDQMVTIGGFESTPFEFETNDEADYGTGWFSQYAAYTYVIDEI